MKKLAKKELNELYGGEITNSNNNELLTSKRNTNSVSNCVCTYDNMSVISNTNNISGCSCECSGHNNNLF